MKIVIDLKKTPLLNFKKEVISNLNSKGVVIIRNLFDKNTIKEINKGWDTYFKNPSISGTVGYAQTSPKKRIVDSAFLLSKYVLTVALEKKIIDSIEGYMKSDCTLFEAFAAMDISSSYEYFPVHSDFSVGWKKSKKMKKSLSLSDMKKPVGIGLILYLHDTKHGCFQYSLASHKLLSPYGQSLESYPKENKTEILSNIYRCEGLAGDIILFDDRGFHGPAQPSKEDRKVLIFDYIRNKTLGSIIVAPHKVKINDLAKLNKKQLNVLGLNANPILQNQDYVFTRYKNNFFFPIIVWIVKKSFLKQHIKNIVKNNLLKLGIKL